MFSPNDVWWCCCELGWLCQDQSFLTEEKHLKVSNFLRISPYTLYVYTTVTIWLLHLFCLANQQGFRNKMERKHEKATSRIYNDWTVGFAVKDKIQIEIPTSTCWGGLFDIRYSTPYHTQLQAVLLVCWILSCSLGLWRIWGRVSVEDKWR